MSISSAINAARSGLQISSLRADIVATNVANAATPGYVRRALVIGETIVGGQTTGVRSNGVARSETDTLTGQRRELSSDLAQARILSSTWQTISNRMGSTLDGGGLFSSFATFESAVADAALSPESSATASALLDAAKGIGREFNALSDMAVNLRKEADREIASGVDTVNAALKQIQSLNARIAGSDRTTNQAAALFDERGRVLDTVAEYLPIESVPRDSGVIDVMTKEGVFLLSGQARTIEFNPSASFQAGQSLASGQLSGISVEGVDITPGAASFGAVSGGMLGALFQLRDTDVPTFSRQLDTVAADLVARLSDPAIDATKIPGEFGLFVDSSAGGGPGLAGRLQVNAAVDPQQGGQLSRLRDGIGASSTGPAGDATLLQRISGAVTDVRSISGNGIEGSFSSSEMAAHLSSIAGQSRVSYEAVLSSTNTQHILLSEAELSETGVDIDTQMQDLLLIEQAYSANARVIEIASQMLNRLMEI